MFRYLLLSLCGAAFGSLAAAGVFTVLAAVGLIPRFTGRTHSAGCIILYEEMVIAGTIIGCILSVFPEFCQIGLFFRHRIADMASGWERLWNFSCGGVLGIAGLFCGMFVGCLALAIAEMLDSIPILARRISFRHGIGLAVLSMAAGKLIGSLLYFAKELYHVVQ